MNAPPRESRSRDAILREAARLVTVEGIDGLSIARLAEAVGLSKSGLFAHFKSKEELQLATIETADRIFRDEVVAPARAKGPGLERLRALCDEFLAHLERGVFPGGCFFTSAAAELSPRPGPVREAIAASYREWIGLLEEQAEKAKELGELDASTDTPQLVFELNGMLIVANIFYFLFEDAAELERARRGVRKRLENSG